MDNGSGEMLICSLGAALCLLPLGSVVETFRPLPVEPVAGAPDFVRGLAIVRGAPVPVVDLGRLVGGRAGGATRRFVTVKTGKRVVALAVDDVIGVRRMPAEEVGSLPPLLGDAGTEAVTAVGTLDADLFVVLDASRIVPDGLLDDAIQRRLAS